MISRPRFPVSYYLSIICLFCSLNQLVLQTEGSSNETDLVSLIAIKDQIQGGGLSSWNKSFHFCHWQGITCSKRHAQRVISLNVSNQNLVGNLSPHIGNLSFLRIFFIKNNNFYGEIPQEIGHLFRLRGLHLNNNHFEGKIPVSLSQCTHLVSLNLGENKLSGKIPTELGSLSNLFFLLFDKNNLTGEIPPSMGNLSSLSTFSLNDNMLDGSIPDSLGKLSSLTNLLIGVNRFSGEVPLQIYNSSSLRNLGLFSNQFTGTLPSDIAITLPNLQRLAAGGNNLSGSLPMSFANASSLLYLDLPENNFTGQVPSCRALKNLFWLALGLNNLGGEDDDLSFITSLTNSSNLQILIFSNNNFRGVLPNSISNLSTQIEKLYLGGNPISGIIPEGIGNLVNLIGLGLDSTHIHGSIPTSIGNIQTLQILNLNDNYLTGFIPSSLASITRLSSLDISWNRLEGSIPSSFGGFRYLQSLYLNGNNLNSTIPQHMFDITSLSLFLDLSQNSFSGSLPEEVGNLQNLGKLDVSGNKLSGKIPSTLGKCLVMEEIILGNNLFEGTIPQSFSSLKSLLYLDLARNNMSGPIPLYLESFQYLKILNLSFNKFEGGVPMGGVFKSKTSVLVAGNLELCGGIQELKLPKCVIKHNKKHGKPGAFKLAIAISLALFFILASCLLICYWKGKPKLKSSSSSKKEQHSRVSYRELFQATGGFAPANILGSGSFGCVYKGMLRQEEMIVAIKVFFLQHVGASKSFMAECESLRNIRHRNLVKILTSCSSTDFEGNDFKALVFQFMPNGSLEKWLHQECEGPDAQSRKLNVHQRLNIAIDVASALNYLHQQCHVSVIHRDLKPSNVLLDDDMVAHVSDFGLAKILSSSVENPSNNQSASIGVKGSIGYAAPEYGMGGEASMQGDMYSYGILLLEMFIGKRPTDDMFKDGLNIHNYARNALPDQVLQIVDPILLSEEDETTRDTNGTSKQSERRTRLLECVTSIIKVGVSCSLETPLERMEDVSGELHVIRDRYLGTGIHEEVRG